MKVCIFIIFYIFTGISYVLAKDNQIDNIVAIVNDQIILSSDVDKVLLFLQKAGKNFKIPLHSNFLKEKVIQKLIVDSLILQEAHRMNITINEQQINTVIKNIALKKNISFDQLKNDILLHDLKSRFHHDNYINNIKKLLKIKMTSDYELHNRIHISEQEVNLVLNKLLKNKKQSQKISLSYIFLPSLKKDSEIVISKRKRIAENMVKKLQQGYDFEKLFLECKKNKSVFLEKKIFWMRYSDIQKNFSDVVNVFKKGQILGPFLKNKGFYILKVNDIVNNEEEIINEFYVQHCLIKPSLILTDEESKKNIFNIYKNIKKGMYSFDNAVKKLSHDFHTSNKHGDLGWISKEFFSSNIDKEFLFLNRNQISKPIRSPFGWHIFKLLDKRQTDKFYNFQKQKAYNILLNQKMILEKQNWINDLKNNAYIKIIR
ncbi:peptidylprolyl isomerase [uncultured Buchnera sp.]|uniref:peptidylprolyl isomerase n=1 Tax=uncultured Buchnera sp. TaxID=574037 RepID=UPI0025DB8A3C|nr:peptidylprolyl isomerase [uncultured Buchnera sp.]